MDCVRFAPLDGGWDAGALAGVKRRALGLVPEDEPALRDLIARHRARGGFRGFRADVGCRAVGFAYGAPVDMAWGWAQLIERHLASGADRELWLYHSFAVSELYVDPACQGRGVGGELMRRLCGSATQDRALLTVPRAGWPAQSLYRRLGFTDLGCRVRSSVREYILMGASLPLPGR